MCPGKQGNSYSGIISGLFGLSVHAPKGGWIGRSECADTQSEGDGICKQCRNTPEAADVHSRCQAAACPPLPVARHCRRPRASPSVSEDCGGTCKPREEEGNPSGVSGQEPPRQTPEYNSRTLWASAIILWSSTGTHLDWEYDAPRLIARTSRYTAVATKAGPVMAAERRAARSENSRSDAASIAVTLAFKDAARVVCMWDNKQVTKFAVEPWWWWMPDGCLLQHHRHRVLLLLYMGARRALDTRLLSRTIRAHQVVWWLESKQLFAAILPGMCCGGRLGDAVDSTATRPTG